MAKTLKSTYERIYFLVKSKLYTESLLKTFEIQDQLFSRNSFQITASDNDKTEIRKCNAVSCLSRCSQKFNNINRKTPVSKYLNACNQKQSFENVWRRCFPGNVAKFLRIPLFIEHLWWLLPCNFIKKRLRHSCFPMKFPKFLRTPFLKEHLRWLLPTVSWVLPRRVNRNFSEYTSCQRPYWKNYSLEGYPDNCSPVRVPVRVRVGRQFSSGTIALEPSGTIFKIYLFFTTADMLIE